ncbi:MAG: hypothetical protein WDN28_03185 [Chthoniobacter sp.]
MKTRTPVLMAGGFDCSFLLPLSQNPRTDIGRALIEPNAICLAAGQEAHHITAHEAHFFQIKNHAPTFRADERFQLRDMFRFDSATQGEYDKFCVQQSLNLQHAKSAC